MDGAVDSREVGLQCKTLVGRRRYPYISLRSSRASEKLATDVTLSRAAFLSVELVSFTTLRAITAADRVPWAAVDVITVSARCDIALIQVKSSQGESKIFPYPLRPFSLPMPLTSGQKRAQVHSCCSKADSQRYISTRPLLLVRVCISRTLCGSWRMVERLSSSNRPAWCSASIRLFGTLGVVAIAL